jgi:predicted DNA-binding transcriptional regulator AlpA
MTVLLRFRQLKERGVVGSWPQLKRLQEGQGFPPGRMLSPNVRAWTEEEIDAWLASRPIAGPAPRGIAKTKAIARRDRKAAEDSATA